MRNFIHAHQNRITGTIECFDRLLFKGHLPLGWPDAMESFIARHGLRVKDFRHFVEKHSKSLIAHARAMALHLQTYPEAFMTAAV